MTIWRDLEILDAGGFLRRVRGGAARLGPNNEPSFMMKETVGLKAKRSIARFVCGQFIKPGQTILLEGGTTAAALIPYLPAGGVSILTNSLPIAQRVFAGRYPFKVTVVGGNLSGVSGNFLGPDAIAALKGKKVDYFFMGATGVDVRRGITDPNPAEIEVKRAMAKVAKKTMLLADADKLGRVSLHAVMPFEEIDALVTDGDAPAWRVREIKEAGVKVLLADPRPDEDPVPLRPGPKVDFVQLPDLVRGAPPVDDAPRTAEQAGFRSSGGTPADGAV